MVTDHDERRDARHDERYDERHDERHHDSSSYILIAHLHGLLLMLMTACCWVR